VASFAGFAPINNPSIAVAVILDSAVGLHQGGQVSAPVFQRVTQQVLEYLHTPHDVELPPSRQVLLAERRVNEQDVEEGSPDRLGDTLEMAEASATEANPRPPTESATPPPALPGQRVVSATLRQPEPVLSTAQEQKGDTETHGQSEALNPVRLPSNGTVVLEVEQGRIVVPSFLGKSVRAAVEMAQESGLDLDAMGSGLAREQSPPAGCHVAAGSQVTVKFGR
jgi:cell division protein FtsI (penicillin-binding protein 3)